MLSIYQFDDYKKFLIAKIEAAPNAGRGVRRRLAEATGCQVAYISHVLAADKNLSPEQAEAATRFFKLREDEADFFLLLVQLARAGTVELRRYLNRQIEAKRQEQNEIKKRIRIHQEISSADQATYYSSWHYQAIRTITTIPEFRSAEFIAERLQIPLERVQEVLKFLLEKGLLKETEKGLISTQNLIHLPRTSPLISRLHTNWRVRSLSAFDRKRADDYHYSGLFTLSKKDVGKIREILMEALNQSAEVVKPSKEETICAIALDLYEL
jgi:uncharacterized protein (TIGR02147 family)